MKKTNYFLILCFLLNLIFLNIQSQNFLSASGNKLIDSKGNTVRLTGVNWFGFETNMKYPHGLWSRDCWSMLKEIKDNGFNCIRFPYSNDILKSDATIRVDSYGTDPYTGISPINKTEATLNTPLELLDKIVEYCQKLNLKIILDNHSRKSDNFLNEAVWYTSTVSEEKWIADWVTLAARYKNNDAVIAMDLDNEPNGNYSQGSTWGNSNPLTDWNKAAERCGNAILNANPNVLILVEGVQTYSGDSYWWGGNLKGAATYPVVLSNNNKLVYSPHEYGPEVFNQSWFTASTFPGNMEAIWNSHFGYLYTSNTAPLLLGEFGIKDTASYSGTEGKWFDTLLAFMGNKYSWTFWCWNPNSGDTGGLLDDQWQNPVQWKIKKLKPYMAPEIPNTSNSTANKAPVAVANASITAGIAPLTVTFDASASSDQDGDALTFTWNFGDNTTGTGSKPNHIYTAIGTYSAVVTVLDGKGGSSTASIAITVNAVNVLPTSVSITPTVVSISISDTLQLTSTVLPSNANQSVVWSSSNTAIVNVSAKGLIVGVSNGTATVKVTTADSSKTAQIAVTVADGSLCSFGTPMATALPTISNKTYTYVYTLGTGAPSLSSIKNFTINWDLNNNGLYQFSVNTKDGKPNWFIDLRSGATQTFASTQPSITFLGTGITGLDGSYYAGIDNDNFVLVSKTGKFAIYFSNSATAPACLKSAKNTFVADYADSKAILYPNPFKTNITIQVTNIQLPATICVTNELGSPVKQIVVTKVNGDQIEFGSELPYGVYIVQIQDGTTVKSYKVIKNK